MVEACLTRDTFMEEVRIGLRKYRAAVTELDCCDGSDFKFALDKAEESRLTFLAAQHKLSQHRILHGCE